MCQRVKFIDLGAFGGHWLSLLHEVKCHLMIIGDFLVKYCSFLCLLLHLLTVYNSKLRRNDITCSCIYTHVYVCITCSCTCTYVLPVCVHMPCMSTAKKMK